MSSERARTLDVLAVAIGDLAPTIAQFNRRQMRAARWHPSFVRIDHDLSGPAKTLRHWSSAEDGALYQFSEQFFGEGTYVESAMCTLGYSLHAACLVSEYRRVLRVMFGGRRRVWALRHSYQRPPQWRGQFIRLLVVDDGVPILTCNQTRFSGDTSGLRQILRSIDWPELNRDPLTAEDAFDR